MLKPYTILVTMNNSDVVVWHGWALDAYTARLLIEEQYTKNGWIQDVEKIRILVNRERQHAGFTMLKQIAGARSGVKA